MTGGNDASSCIGWWASFVLYYHGGQEKEKESQWCHQRLSEKSGDFKLTVLAARGLEAWVQQDVVALVMSVKSCHENQTAERINWQLTDVIVRISQQPACSVQDDRQLRAHRGQEVWGGAAPKQTVEVKHEAAAAVWCPSETSLQRVKWNKLQAEGHDVCVCVCVCVCEMIRAGPAD